jgi:hypothetical protein
VIFSAPADHVFPAIDEVQIFFSIASHHVAGVEPATFPGGFRRLRVAQVFGEEAGTRIGTGSAHQQFARRAIVDIDARSIDDAVLHEGPGSSEARFADVPWFMAGDYDGTRAGLGHRPGADRRNAEPFLERGVVARIDARREAEPHVMRPIIG